jgi:uncharacterized protein
VDEGVAMRAITDLDNSLAWIGLAYGMGVPGFLDRHPNRIDYVEIPFEQLRHDPSVASIQEILPVILHCASMSVASFVPIADATLAAIQCEASRLKTPWIGEHLAFISADFPIGYANGDAKRHILLNHTVCPQLSQEVLQQVFDNLISLSSRFPMPLILENPPQYFQVPGSTMSMVDFIIHLCRMSDIDLILDLSHFLITSINMGLNPTKEIDRLPLERVREIHISGMNIHAGIAWDDHSIPASETVFELLRQVLRRAKPEALTFEYNWAPDFLDEVLLRQIDRAREMLGASRGN